MIMPATFICISDADYITTRDNCAINCNNDSCEMRRKCINERNHIINSVRKYSLGHIIKNPDDVIKDIDKDINN